VKIWQIHYAANSEQYKNSLLANKNLANFLDSPNSSHAKLLLLTVNSPWFLLHIMSPKLAHLQQLRLLVWLMMHKRLLPALKNVCLI